MHAVIPAAGDRPSNNDNANDLIAECCADREQVANHRRVMPVVFRHEGVSLSKFDADVLEFHRLPRKKVGQ